MVESEQKRKLSPEEYQQKLIQWFLSFDEAVASVMAGTNPFSVDLWKK